MRGKRSSSSPSSTYTSPLIETATGGAPDPVSWTGSTAAGLNAAASCGERIQTRPSGAAMTTRSPPMRTMDSGGSSTSPARETAAVLIGVMPRGPVSKT